ncbi:MAG: hypothetical protein ACE5JC_05705 [Candidatus Zixiibacteriota bacterium]
MKNKDLILLSLSVLVFWLASEAFADRRSYVWTYEYKTVEKGEAEVESYFTLSTPDIGKIKGTMGSEHQIELEVGMTEHFDFSIYQVFSQNPGEGLEYKGFKLRSRYRIGEKGRYILDPLIYLEYKGKPDFSEHGVEFKLVLAKDAGRFNIALNPVFEFERKQEWEFEPEYAVGISYEIGELLRVGLEAKGSEDGDYLGPVVSHGREDLWVTLGSAFQVGEIEDGKPEFQIRMLLGVGL